MAAASWRWIRRLAAPLLLFLSAIAVRILGWPAVFQPDGTYPLGNDAYYHLRRVQSMVEKFPSFLTFDPFINFPHGARPIWPPTFDWFLGLAMRILVGPGRSDAVENWLMLLPPVLGALTVVLLYYLARSHFSTRVALLASGLLVIMPAHHSYSQLGFLDHHVAVSLLTTLVLWASMSLLSCEPRGTASHWPLLRGGILLGLALATSVAIWPGSLIHVAIVQAGLVVCLLFTSHRARAVARSRAFALCHLVAALLLSPLGLGQEWERWGSFTPVVLSNFQPLYFAAWALGFGLTGEVWRRWDACGRRGVRIASAVTLGAGLLSAAFAVLPAMRVAALDAWMWFAKAEEFQAVVAESEPLIRGGTPSDWWIPIQFLTPFVYLVPIPCVLLAWAGRRSGERLFLAAWTLALFVATLNQRRFMNSYSVAHALLLAWFSWTCIDWARARLSTASALKRRAISVLAVVLLLVVVAPSILGYTPYLLDLRSRLRGETPTPVGISHDMRLVVESARWLRKNSAPLGVRGYSVLGPWGDGHILKYVAARPVVQDNFGDDVAPENFALAEEYFSALHEREALEIIAPLRTRYVQVRSTGSGHGGEYKPSSIFHRLYLLRGSRNRVSRRGSSEFVVVPSLKRHRIVYESPPADERERTRNSLVKIFEVVAGARVVGDARPGAVVMVKLDVQSRHGEPFEYRSLTRADQSGRYALRLPYSNERFSPDVKVGEHYTIASERRQDEFAISEEAVQGGLSLEGPPL
jgi:dolichyl-diphosphooligosaccharide--protein glycosyltransferase